VERLITQDNLKKLIESETGKHTRVVAPVRSEKGRFYRVISNADEMDLDNAGAPPERSLKEFFFPKTEILLSYKYTQDGVKMDSPQDPLPTLILGARPCDARALLLLDKVFGWDYDDDLYRKRREGTTLLSLYCQSEEEDCFCEMLGSSREDRSGSDLFLFPVKEGFVVEAVTEKGTQLMESHAGLFQDVGSAVRPKASQEQARVVSDMDALTSWLAGAFEEKAWANLGIRCLGCGACAHVCPACHCFDIVDEPDHVKAGKRRRNWDSCQIPLFTLHASGHNPRSLQSQRYRQRILHKFSYFPERFDAILCTGCGRCSRACPADQNLLAALEDLWSLAQQSK